MTKKPETEAVFLNRPTFPKAGVESASIRRSIQKPALPFRNLLQLSSARSGFGKHGPGRPHQLCQLVGIIQIVDPVVGSAAFIGDGFLKEPAKQFSSRLRGLKVETVVTDQADDLAVAVDAVISEQLDGLNRAGPFQLRTHEIHKFPAGCHSSLLFPQAGPETTLADHSADLDESALPVLLTEVVLTDPLAGAGAVHKIAPSSVQRCMQPSASASCSKNKDVSRAHGTATDAVPGIGLILGNPGHIDAMLPVRPPNESRTVKTARRRTAEPIADTDL